MTVQGAALWRLGFRPLYLLAALSAALAVAYWVAGFVGEIDLAPAARSSLWHAHEMLFGYALAVIVGFLFTAVRTWTGKSTPTGVALGFICLLWVAGRLFALSPWPLLGIAADAAFCLAAAFGIAVPLTAARNQRNYFFIALIIALGAAGIAMQLAVLDLIDIPVHLGLRVGLDLVMFVIAVMAGRVVPMFTANGVPSTTPRRVAWLERSALGSLLLVIALDLAAAPSMLLAVVLTITGAAHAARLALWQPLRTLRTPIVWILHASYAWIAIHLVLRAVALIGWAPEGLATHALTVGAIGGMTLGMMTRTARGHTGRPLEPGWAEVTAYVLVQLAAVTRVFVPLAAPALYLPAIHLSGALWVGAFLLFCAAFFPILTRPRIDGRPG